jgi:preprotein translocase subunit SecG
MESKLGDNIDNNVIAQNVGNNQIFLPKNSVPAQPSGNAPVVNNAIDNVNSNQAPALNVSVSTGSYYNLFGVEVSKTTVYIAVVFILLVGVYYYYTKNNTKPTEDKEDDKKKKKRKDKKSKDEGKSTTTEESG